MLPIRCARLLPRTPESEKLMRRSTTRISDFSFPLFFPPLFAKVTEATGTGKFAWGLGCRSPANPTHSPDGQKRIHPRPRALGGLGADGMKKQILTQKANPYPFRYDCALGVFRAGFKSMSISTPFLPPPPPSPALRRCGCGRVEKGNPYPSGNGPGDPVHLFFRRG
jgi:hypothetical protein